LGEHRVRGSGDRRFFCPVGKELIGETMPSKRDTGLRRRVGGVGFEIGGEDRTGVFEYWLQLGQFHDAPLPARRHRTRTGEVVAGPRRRPSVGEAVRPWAFRSDDEV
jgi:hypothetical protein